MIALASQYGLLMVLVGTFFEGEGVLMMAAVLAQQRVLNFTEVVLTASAGAWLGHLFWFLIGRRFPGGIPRVASKRLAETVARMKRVLEVHPRTAIFILQYLYGMRMMGAVALGSTTLPFGRFALYEAVNCLVWAGLVTSAGYFAGEAVTALFHGWLKWVWMGLSLLFIALIFRFLDRWIADGRA